MMKKEAFTIWMDLPVDTRRKILSNVWCGQCATSVTMCDYDASFDRGVVVLRGFCSVCGHKVARVLEGCAEDSDNFRKRTNMSKPKRQMAKDPKQKCALEYYIFDIWVAGTSGVCNFEGKVLRKIQIAKTKSLYNFARVITQAFNFYFDHCFAFYDNFQRYHDSTKAYELFVDIGEAPLVQAAKGVKKTRIQQAFKNPGEKMLFLFDYGDCWYFAVELKEIKNAENWDLKPVILESIGEAPLQYPPCEDEFEDEE